MGMAKKRKAEEETEYLLIAVKKNYATRTHYFKAIIDNT